MNDSNVSFKARQAPKLAFKLHKLKCVSATGIGAATASKPNRSLGQGKRKLWLGMEESTILLSTSDSVSTDNDRCLKINRTLQRQTRFYQVQPLVENLRSIHVLRLRQQLRQTCLALKPPIVLPQLVFERWLLDNLSLRSNEMNDREKVLFDPLLPTNPDTTSTTTLIADFIRASMSKKNAERIAKEICQKSIAAAKICNAFEVSLMKQNKMDTRVVVTKHRHSIDLILKTTKKKKKQKKQKLLKLNHEHYNKLLSLWRLSRKYRGTRMYTEQRISSTNERISSTNDFKTNVLKNCDSKIEDIENFHSSVYTLLSRYFTLAGHGFQAACSEHVFGVFRDVLGVQHECFASPLNCYLPSYCSAFPDIDSEFLSGGSFWNFPFSSGSFQANPPFVPSVMLAMVDRIESFLESTSSTDEEMPLSFVIVVPCWIEDVSYNKLIKSSYMRHHIVISKQDHGFCDGAQHQRRDRYRASPYDTSVFILQNKTGAIKWSIDESKILEIKKAFAMAVPSPAAIERRKRKGRGFADEDGGGGVYKGKKQKKKKQKKRRRI